MTTDKYLFIKFKDFVATSIVILIPMHGEEEGILMCLLLTKNVTQQEKKKKVPVLKRRLY